MLIRHALNEAQEVDLCKALGLVDERGRPNKWGNPTWPLPNLRPIEAKEFWGWQASYTMKAEAWLGSYKVDGEHANVIAYWANLAGLENAGFAVAIIYRGTVADEAKYFWWGVCDHKWSHKTIGNCLHKYTCTKCGASHEVDSGG